MGHHFHGAGWTGQREIGSRQALGTSPDVPETMQSLPSIPCLLAPLVYSRYSFFVVVAQHFIMKVFDHSTKLKDTTLFFNELQRKLHVLVHFTSNHFNRHLVRVK